MFALVHVLMSPAAWSAEAPDAFDVITEKLGAAYASGDLDTAQALADELLDLQTRTVGAESVEVASTIAVMGTLHYARGEFAEAEVRYTESLALYELLRGPGHVDAAIAMFSMGQLKVGVGEYAAAQALFEQCVQVWRSAGGPRDPKVAMGLDNLASALRWQGKYAEAKPYLKESLDIRRESLGPRHPDVAYSLNDMGALNTALGEFAEAQAFHEEALDIRREALGPRHPEVSMSLDNLGLALLEQGHYRAARPILEESTSIARETLGPDDPHTVRTLNSLASLLQLQGEFGEAMSMYESVLAVRRAVLAPNHPDTANALNNLAAAHFDAGNHPLARELYEEAIEINRATQGERSHPVAVAMNNLAVVVQHQGDRSGALALLEESHDIWLEGLGPDHPYIGQSLNNIGNLLVATGQYDDARMRIEAAIEVARRAFGPAHRDVAVGLTNLGGLHVALEDYPAARQHYQQSLDIRKEAFGASHRLVAESLGNVAETYYMERDFEAARELREESLQMTLDTLGESHWLVATSRSNLASVLEFQNEPGASLLRSQALATVEARLAHLDSLSERGAMDFLDQSRDLFDRWLVTHDGAEHATESWTHALRFKGAVAQRLSAARALAAVDDDAAETASELGAIRRELSQLAFAERLPGDTSGEERVEGLTAEREKLERQLLQRSADFRSSEEARDADPTRLCAALEDGALLVDFLRYTHRNHVPHYLAFAMSGGDCEVHRVELGPASEIDKSVEAWRRSLSDPDALQRRIDDRGAAVRERIWDPIEAIVGRPDRLLASPDGPLSAAPLGALPTGSDRYLIEEVAISYMDRVNDLLRTPVDPSSGALVVGGVSYDAAGGAGTGHRTRMAACNGGGFEDLPGAALEADLLALRWKQSRRKTELEVLTGSDATESRVAQALSGKEVVHLATHAFFATGECRSQLESGGVTDPMLLSGLALAGANRPADATAQADGILTAAELAAVDLGGTQLVVLSACSTGLGEVRSGEGVMGLRRAFSVAGAENLVTSLWAVSDDATVALMDAMYRQLLHRRRPLAPMDALRVAKLARLEAQRNEGEVRPWEWAGFVASNHGP